MFIVVRFSNTKNLLYANKSYKLCWKLI